MLKQPYIRNHQARLHNNLIHRQPGVSPQFRLTITKQYSHTLQHYRPNIPKQPNIAMVFEVTVYKPTYASLTPQLVLCTTCIVIQSLLLDSLSDLSLTSFLSQGCPPRRLLQTCHLTQVSSTSCLCVIVPESDRTSMCLCTTLECALLERSLIMQPTYQKNQLFLLPLLSVEGHQLW